jgi:SAM-dependent methyltransferase
MKTKNKTWFSNHSHSWIVIIAASILAIIFINWLPQQKVFSSILIGLVVSHTLILLIVTFGGWLLLPEKKIKKRLKQKSATDYDFGWSTKWINGFGFASFIVVLIAFYSFYALTRSPILQILVFSILLLLAVNLFIGNIIAKASKSESENILPYVDIFKAGRNNILDAGCGAGRTTVALSKIGSDFKIVSFDRFDASYIDDGGKTLLKHNIELAGLSSRVTVEQGDITATPFAENHFDAAVSAYMFDHLGENKLSALKEMQRILKSGGRFLLIVLVRGYTAFAIANMLSLVIAPRKVWRQLFKQSGLTLVDEGTINFGAYFLVEKAI